MVDHFVDQAKIQCDFIEKQRETWTQFVTYFEDLKSQQPKPRKFKKSRTKKIEHHVEQPVVEPIMAPAFKTPRLSVDGGLYNSKDGSEPIQSLEQDIPTTIKFKEGPPITIVNRSPDRIIKLISTQPKSILKPPKLPFDPILNDSPTARNTPEVMVAPVDVADMIEEAEEHSFNIS
jgi:hypothetical protein